jgi:hypothetical protein
MEKGTAPLLIERAGKATSKLISVRSHALQCMRNVRYNSDAHLRTATLLAPIGQLVVPHSVSTGEQYAVSAEYIWREGVDVNVCFMVNLQHKLNLYHSNKLTKQYRLALRNDVFFEPANIIWHTRKHAMITPCPNFTEQEINEALITIENGLSK